MKVCQVCSPIRFLTLLALLSFEGFPQEQFPDGFSFTTGSNVPFYSDKNLSYPSLIQFNRFGSFGSHTNGLKAGALTDFLEFTGQYEYANFDGYREHSNEYWHRAYVSVEAKPTDRTRLSVSGLFRDGEIKRPGSLTREEYADDPYQPDQRSVNRDEKRISTQGDFSILYSSSFGKERNNRIEINPFGTIESFVRSTREYSVINRYELGFSAKYINTDSIGRHSNAFSLEGTLFFEPEREEEYENFSGQQSDQLEQLLSEKFTGQELILTDRFGILEDKLSASIRMEYDHIVYRISEETLPSRSDEKIFEAFTPELVLEHRALKWLSWFASGEMNFVTPALNQMESPDPTYLYNQDLKAQLSGTARLGIRAEYDKNGPSSWLRKIRFETSLSWTRFDNDIVRYEVYGDLYYRNAARTYKLEAAIRGETELVKDLVFSFSYRWNQSKYDSYLADSWEADSSGTLVVKERDFSGNRVPNLPAHLLKLEFSYKYQLIPRIRLQAEAGYTGSGPMWVDDANSDRSPGYNLLNAGLGFEMKFGRFFFDITGGIENILDEVYMANVNINSADRRFYYAAPPRSYYCSLNIGYAF